jgi:hypothetical protein
MQSEYTTGFSFPSRSIFDVAWGPRETQSRQVLQSLATDPTRSQWATDPGCGLMLILRVLRKEFHLDQLVAALANDFVELISGH